MTRDEMINAMVGLFGHEDERVVDFCKLCDCWESNAWNDKVLEICVKAYVKVFSKKNKKTLDK